MNLGKPKLVLEFAAERGDLVGGKAKEESPEVCGSRGKASIGPEHFEDLFLVEGATEPGDCLLIPVLEHTLDGVDGGCKARCTTLVTHVPAVFDQVRLDPLVNGVVYEAVVKGSIAAGKYADFVVLRQDPHDVDPDAIKEIEVVRTVVGGRTMHPKAA